MTDTQIKEHIYKVHERNINWEIKNRSTWQVQINSKN